ncbi:hypothetical protein [Paracoccus litorisediminis]|uniref:Uncharacterized protein n=1 Tax=Paracoccus litorisediminis TaxID=2006130 RepID=A0A844HLA7_9RHOB|nr:hypothetical protein [Paracoccus litorisediminis]MTH58462.1 hypothetical protein [Paracoccus litorisediminis]
MQLAGNWRQAILLSIGPLLVQTAALGLAIFMLGGLHAPPQSIFFFFFVWALTFGAILFSAAWLATRWHRFVLLAEVQRAFSRPRQILPYLKTMLLTLVLMAAIAIPMLLFALTAMRMVNQETIPAATRFFSVAGTFIFYIFVLRLSTALPGAAIGAAKPIKRSWIAMGKTSRTLAILVLGYMLFQWGFQALAGGHTNFGKLPSVWWIAAQLGIYWFSVLFYLSVLTTLWGHYVEARPLR